VTYDYATVHSIVNTTSVLHVSFPPTNDDPFPAILPMIGVVGSFSNPNAALSEPQDLYLHGYVSSRIMRASSSPSSSEGLPLSIAASKVDGIILALTPNNHSLNYRSAIIYGYATPVTDIDEKIWAMQLITNNVLPTRYENTRVPPDKTETTSTQILKVTIESASAKIRSGGPHDERKDLKNTEVREKVWTGTIPVWEALGEPIVGTDNLVKNVPGYVSNWVNKENEARKNFAVENVNEK
jgi:nitroimidazol reductase NimA-like FMN-containing flavoprotein (pyridoxamine 5'-phosphate oxidase superfamily)